MTTITTDRVTLTPIDRALHALTAAQDTPAPDVVSRLRAATQRTQGPTLAQVTRVVDGLLAVESRDSIAAATGLSADEVLTCVASLGTWLRHVRGELTFTLVKADSEQEALWQAPPAADGSVDVIIPPGFERAGSGRRRDVTRALGALVAARPTADELARWVARQTPATTEVVEWSLLAMVHTFARLGRAEELDAINPDSFELSQAIANAWDLLDTRRMDALAAAERVLSATEPDRGDVRVASVLHEAAFTRLERMIGVREDLFDKERATLAATLLDGCIPGSVAELTAAQVRRIAEASGLAIEAPSRTEEGEIRSRLIALGLGSDVDQLVPAASRAINAGVEDAFWEAMELRADGVEDWKAPLVAASAA